MESLTRLKVSHWLSEYSPAQSISVVLLVEDILHQVEAGNLSQYTLQVVIARICDDFHLTTCCFLIWVLTQPMDPEKKSLNFIFPTKYVIPQKKKFSHWPSKSIASVSTNTDLNLKWFNNNFRSFFVPAETIFTCRKLMISDSDVKESKHKLFNRLLTILDCSICWKSTEIVFVAYFSVFWRFWL